MKPFAGLLTALSIACSMVTPTFAQEDGAKGLFFQQLENPKAQMNTGIQYWIELRRDGRTMQATNKTQFQSGDKIRFHVTPNIDGYAYILLKSGSRGEQAQLFPDAERKENNRISRGKEIVLPNDGVLTFDSNPGTEKLTLIVSRQEIDSQAYMNDNSDTQAPRIAMASSGSKDLIPNQVLVSYVSPPPAKIPGGPPHTVTNSAAGVSGKAKDNSAGKIAHATAVKGTAAEVKEGNDTRENKVVKEAKIESAPISSKKEPTASAKSAAKAEKSKQHKTGVKPVVASSATTVSDENKRDARTLQQTSKSKHAVSGKTTLSAQSPKPTSTKPLQSGVVTVVYQDPNGILSADISLEHM